MGGGWLVGRGVSWSPCKGPDRLAGRAGGSVEQGDAQSSRKRLLAADSEEEGEGDPRSTASFPGLPIPPPPSGAAGM